MSRTGKFIALVLALGLALTGCRTNNNGGDGTEERPVQKADQNQMNPQPRDRVPIAPIGHLHIDEHKIGIDANRSGLIFTLFSSLFRW